ncbi:MAG: hypothetical protein MCS20_02370, partial [Candidatus Phytoplasma mali]|nr:hypothetical protein [Candidatus Phytoplasma australiense]MCG7202227.1 hypothetical protein [Candidatus Phytoplasma mali]MCZ8633110.1 hypothetical protein [Spiroplasma sp. Tabriz.8]
IYGMLNYVIVKYQREIKKLLSVPIYIYIYIYIYKSCSIFINFRIIMNNFIGIRELNAFFIYTYYLKL